MPKPTPEPSAAVPHPLLAGIPTWCLHTLPADGPQLVGVVPEAGSITLHIIELDVDTPLADLASLAAPPDWELLAVTCTIGWLPIAHAVDRNGHRSTELGPADALPAALLATIDRLHEVCCGLFGLELDAA